MSWVDTLRRVPLTVVQSDYDPARRELPRFVHEAWDLDAAEVLAGAQAASRGELCGHGRSRAYWYGHTRVASRFDDQRDPHLDDLTRRCEFASLLAASMRQAGPRPPEYRLN